MQISEFPYLFCINAASDRVWMNVASDHLKPSDGGSESLIISMRKQARWFRVLDSDHNWMCTQFWGDGRRSVFGMGIDWGLELRNVRHDILQNEKTWLTAICSSILKPIKDNHSSKRIDVRAGTPTHFPRNCFPCPIIEPSGEDNNESHYKFPIGVVVVAVLLSLIFFRYLRSIAGSLIKSVVP